MFVQWYLSLALKHTVLAYLTQKRRAAILLMSLLLGVSFNVKSDCSSEQQTAQASLQKIENEWPLRGSGDPVSQYVQKLGDRLAYFSNGGRNIRWRFSVIRNLAPNAYSIGSGYVFITDGAVNFAQNESELVAILAHELGHQLAGHFCADSNLSDTGGLFDIFSTPDSQQYQVGVGSMTQLVDPIKEQQADQIALSILQAGGYNPRAMLDVARRLPSGGAVHLMDINRIQALEYTVATMPAIFIGNSEDFQHIKRLLAAE